MTMTDSTTAPAPAPIPSRKRGRAVFYVLSVALITIGLILLWHFGVFSRKPRIAIVAGEGSYFDLIVAGAREAERQYDVRISVVRVKGDAQEAALRDLVGKGYDGVAVSPFNPTTEAAILSDVA